jgi:hypothetical protein
VSTEILRNREGISEFDVRWPWSEGGQLASGLTAVLRVKDEARNLPWVLPGVFAVADQVVLVDNGSTDGTRDTALRVAQRLGVESRLRTFSYPFDVSRCGQEHRATPGDSVHSLTHFYNWSFAHAATRYSMKWDGDMVLTAEGSATLADVTWQIESGETIVVLHRSPLYIESDRIGYLDLKPGNTEPWVYPMGPEYTFVKGFDWEIRSVPDDVRRLTMPRGLCLELKWLDQDEFAHWTSPEDFTSLRSPRKVREYDVFGKLLQGRLEELDSVVRIEAPDGVHIIDHLAGRGLSQVLSSFAR